MDQNTTLSPTLRLSGDALAKGIKQSVAEAAPRIIAVGVQPKMAVMLAFEDAASLNYAPAKKKTAAQLGIELEIHDLGKDVTQARLPDMCRSLPARPGLQAAGSGCGLPRDQRAEARSACAGVRALEIAGKRL